MKKSKKTNQEDLSFIWKTPPHSKKLEADILGTMIMHRSVITGVKEILNETDFYTESHKVIFKAICEVEKYSNPDFVMIVEWLVKNELMQTVGGPAEITKLTDRVTGETQTNILSYCRIIKQKSLQRKLIQISADVMQKAHDETEDVFDVLRECETNIKTLNSELSEMKITKLETICHNILKTFEERVYKAKNDIHDPNVIYTEIKEWDDINGPLFPGLFVVAGRPGMGKGVHMIELTCRISKTTPLGIINGEMTDEQLLTRCACNIGGINNYLFKKNPKDVTEEESTKLYEAMQEVVNLKLKIFSQKQIDKISNKIRAWVQHHGVRIVLADFLTIFKLPLELERIFVTPKQKTDYILQEFVSLAKELNIPIILYVQMNRGILARSEKTPTLADLKESGSIEELAYQVSFLHRPEYYDKDAIQDENGESVKGLMYQIIAKHREGKLCLDGIKFYADLACSRLRSWNSYVGIEYDSQKIEELPF